MYMHTTHYCYKLPPLLPRSSAGLRWKSSALRGTDPPTGDKGKQYALRVRQEGKGHDLGPPGVHIFLALLEHLLTRNIGELNSSKIDEMFQLEHEEENELNTNFQQLGYE